MAETLKIRICDLLPEFPAHTDIVGSLFKPAGAVAVLCLQTFPDHGCDLLIGVEYDLHKISLLHTLSGYRSAGPVRSYFKSEIPFPQLYKKDCLLSPVHGLIFSKEKDIMSAFERWGSCPDDARLRGYGPTLGTCVGNPTGGKRLILQKSFSRFDAGFFYREMNL